jgi:nodulation protein E
MNTGRRVVVTGLGAISALGHDVPSFWNALREGRSGIGPIEAIDTAQLRFGQGAEVRGFDPLAHLPGRRADHLDRFAQFAVIAARQAVRQSGLEWTEARRTRTAVVMGSTLGGQLAQDQAYADIYRNARGRVDTLTVPRVMTSAATSHLTMEFGVTGPAFTVASACSSAAHAIGVALGMIRSGLADIALTGGSETPFALVHLKAWEALRVVAPDTCRPFCKHRRGMILGEGAAVLVLEAREHAEARGAAILGEIAGFGMSSDAHHLTQPSPLGAAQAMRAALDDAQLSPEQIGYVNAHGTGTQANDVSEAAAIRAVFGAHAPRLPVSSTKSMHGHALGATGALEAVATVLALAEGLLPPTANLIELDDECDIDVIAGEPRRARVEYALSNSFAFGGLNAVLVFRRGPAR